MAASNSGDKPNNESSAADRSRPNAGLCERCVHGRRITSSRGSVFYLCGLSAVDPAYPKYPRLPVIRCDGFRERGKESSE
jgi:hypothetical protein